jgi:hypothetical protein
MTRHKEYSKDGVDIYPEVYEQSQKEIESMEKRQPGEYTTYETRGESNDKVDRAKRYKQIMEILSAYPEGLTAKETAVLMMRKGYTPTAERNFSSPRITELMQQGKVEPIGKKVCEFTGKKVAVYAIRKEK